jgi:predicted methyltransferase
MTELDQPVVLSHFQAEPLLRARKEGQSVAAVSLDLGLTESQATLDEQGARFPNGESLPWKEIESMAGSENKCWWVEGGEAHVIQFFSEETNWVRTLMPTRGAPTMLVSGLSMHRIKGIDPHEDTVLKVRTIAPIVGRVLDTATGLGYTAIEAARTAEQVITIELDPAGLEVARLNPWSRELFINPKIKQIVGDAVEAVETLESSYFSRILHDPPAFSLGGELYTISFYRQLYRVLMRGGRLFHYIGDLESKSGRVTTKGVMQRLEEVGFGRITRRPEAFGVTATK